MNNVFGVGAESNWVPTRGVQQSDLTIGDSVVQLIDGAAFAEKTRAVLVSIEDAPVRMTWDDSDPVGGSHGHRWVAGTVLRMHKEAARMAKFIRDGASDATATITEFTY